MNTKIFSSDEKDLKQWHKYFNKIQSKGVYHDPDYIKFLEQNYYTHCEAELFVFGDNDEFIYYPYFRRSLDSLPVETMKIQLSKYYDIISSWYYGGPILQVRPGSECVKKELARTFVKEFDAYCKGNNIISEFIRFDPLLQNHTAFHEAIDTKLDRLTIYVNLRKTEEQIWKDFETRNRTCIRKAQHNGIKIRSSENIRDIDVFAEIYLKEMKRKNACKHYFLHKKFFHNLSESLAGRFQLFVCEYHGRTIGGGIVIREGGIAHNYLMATDFDYWKYLPNNKLLFEEIKWSRAQEDVIFDLQGGRPGVFNFKKAFSSDRGKFHVAQLIHDRKFYDELLEASGRQEYSKSINYFPGYRNPE